VQIKDFNQYRHSNTHVSINFIGIYIEILIIPKKKWAG
jgi:hypothetical protein